MSGHRNDDQIQTRATTIASQNRFLEEYSRLGTITHSAKAANIKPARHYEWMTRDESYRARFELAHNEAIDSLEREARRRAIEGVEEPVGWYKGEPGGYIKRYSDVLLIFLLKGARPEKYRERHEIVGKDGGPIQIENMPIPIDDFSLEDKRAIIEIIERNRRRIEGASTDADDTDNGNGNDSNNSNDIEVEYRVLGTGNEGIVEYGPTSELPMTYEPDNED